MVTPNLRKIFKEEPPDNPATTTNKNTDKYYDCYCKSPNGEELPIIVDPDEKYKYIQNVMKEILGPAY